jgi:hypothetical protein
LEPPSSERCRKQNSEGLPRGKTLRAPPPQHHQQAPCMPYDPPLAHPYLVLSFLHTFLSRGWWVVISESPWLTSELCGFGSNRTRAGYNNALDITRRRGGAYRLGNPQARSGGALTSFYLLALIPRHRKIAMRIYRNKQDNESYQLYPARRSGKYHDCGDASGRFQPDK